MDKDKMISFLALWGFENDDLAAIIRQTPFDLTSTCLDILANRIGQTREYCQDAYEKFGTLGIRQAFEAVEIARKAYNPNSAMASSASFCLKEAEGRMQEGNANHAHAWALKSVDYSKGKYSEEWEKINSLPPTKQ